MSTQDNQEPNSQQPQIEDLTVNEDEATEVKGGPIYLRLEGVTGDVTSNDVIHKVIET